MYEGAGAAVRVPVFGASSSGFYPHDHGVLWESSMATHTFDRDPTGDKQLKPTSLLQSNICENGRFHPSPEPF